MMRRILLVLVGMCLATTAFAQVSLRFDPADTTLSVGENCRLSIRLDQPVEIRTIDVTVTYDPTIVQSLGGGSGTLYTSSGVYTFQGFEAPVAGQWHGYAVLMGAGLSVHGPGELFYWNFKALANGMSAITAVEVYLATTDGSWFSTVTLPPGKVQVGPLSSGTGDVPTRDASLSVWPNPFNPRTEVKCVLPEAGRATVSVYDARGARVAVVYDAPAAAGPLAVDWDGRDEEGRAMPAGTYIFAVTAPGLQVSTKGVLVK
jgi:hypothetical protein